MSMNDYILSMNRKPPLFYAVCINILFLLLYFAFGQIRFESLDDYFMSSILTGAYGTEYDVHLYFVNSAYGYFLKPFYWLFPKVGWYFIFELLGTFAAFTSISYCLIRQIELKWGTVLSVLLLASLTPDFYFQLSFTQCSTLYTAAGLVTLTLGILEKGKRLLFIGGAFLVAGSVMRYSGFLLGIPYLVLLLLVPCRLRNLITKETLATLCLITVAIYGLHMYDRGLYTDGDYKYYAEYQPIRAYFGDGAFYDRESTFDELEERGMSGLDFNLLKAWMFYDTEVFQKDSLLLIKDVLQNNLYEVNMKRMPVAFFLAMSNALTRTSGWCWAALCFLLMLSKSKKNAVYPWASLGIVAVSISYLLLLNRLVYRVESGIWLYAIVCAIPLLDGSVFYTKPFAPKWNRLLACGIAFGAFLFAVVGITNQHSFKTNVSIADKKNESENWGDFCHYAEKNKGTVFLLSTDRYKEMGEFRNPPYIAVVPGAFDNIVPWGYWNIHLPTMKKELAKRGIENPIHDIVHDNVFFLGDDDALSLEKFYEEHYHQILHVDTVKRFGDMMLLKYRISDSMGMD